MKYTCIIVSILLVSVFGCTSSVVTYPPPPGLETSPDFSMKVNGESTWVERIYNDTANMDYMVYGSKEMEDLNVANFSCEGHSGFSIVCDGPAWVKNIRFEDIRIEEQVEFKNLEFVVTDGTLYGDDPPGHIQGVYLKNIFW